MNAASAHPDGPDTMGRELAEGPAAVERTLANVAAMMPELRALISQCHRLVLVGTGASLAMSRAAAPSWRRRLAQPVIVRQSTESVLSGADGHRFQPGDLVVAISQAGTSPETLAAIRLARSSGADAIAVTAHPASPLGSEAPLVVHVASGEESGAATKSELATLAALLAVSGELECDARSRGALSSALEALVAAWADAAGVGSNLAAAGRVWFVGFGTSLGIAEAGALLWHEKVIRPALAMTPSEFRHGPIEAAGAGDAVVLVDVDPADARRAAYLARLAEELARLGVALVEVQVEPRGSPLAALLRVQQLARAAALSAGTYRDDFAVLRHVVGPASDLFD
jgi:glucosamine--fructose-6-phosphate aminotransferase (isomerizing)